MNEPTKAELMDEIVTMRRRIYYLEAHQGDLEDVASDNERLCAEVKDIRSDINSLHQAFAYFKFQMAVDTADDACEVVDKTAKDHKELKEKIEFQDSKVEGYRFD